MKLSAKSSRTPWLSCGFLLIFGSVSAQVRLIGPIFVRDIIATANQPQYPSIGLSLGVLGAEKAEFEYWGVDPIRDSPNFVVVSPARGVAPAAVSVAPNPNVAPYLPPGTYSLGVGFVIPGQPCSETCGGAILTLRLRPPPSPRVTSVVNAATLEPEITPGTVVAIRGTDLSTPPITAKYDAAGLYPKSLGDTKVTFNGIEAPLLFVSQTQVNAVVPFGVVGQKTVEVALTHYDPAPPFPMPLADISPGIFTATQTGRGLGAFLNQNGTPNTAASPARRGSIISFFATGAGAWMLPVVPNQQPQSVIDGSIFIVWASLVAVPRPAAPVTVMIGGQTAQLVYSGSAPFQVYGMLQVNAIVPEALAPGPQPVLLKVGDRDNAAQQVTMFVE
ncbi:MAG: hypothetical protein IT168_28420 [Bryobacterales bacterium]|nr:hypothetical protein [Bryobacterales bacterium]